MIFRTYFDKDTTIIKDQTINTGRNPITELYYGGETTGNTQYSRYLFYFDVDNLKNKYNEGYLGDLSEITHNLVMYNTGSFDEDLINDKRIDGKIRTSSFDVILFKIDQYWDEGVGYEYDNNVDLIYDKDVYNGATNWFSATTLSAWTESGVYTGSTTELKTQHFQIGNENLEMDVTDIVNELITGTTENYGYGVAFKRNYELKTADDLQYVGFFSRDTQTYFEPFIETVNSSVIKDDRTRFYLDKSNKLYLYSKLNDDFTNLDETPSVTIYDDDDAIYLVIPQSGVTRENKGVYSVEFTVPSSGYSDCVMFKDEWSNIKIGGVSRNPIELYFDVKSDSQYYNIGVSNYTNKEYGLSVHGIKRNEKIKRGDIKRIVVSARESYSVDNEEIIDDLFYRLYIREGDTQINVIDWSETNRDYNNNFFLLDTSWMIPNIYYLELKIESNQEVVTFNEVFSFEIANLK